MPSESLGAELVSFGDPGTGRPRLLISQIRDGSIADRCGALQVGDVIEAINDISTDELDVTEAVQLLDRGGSATIKIHLTPCPENNEMIVGLTSTRLTTEIRFKGTDILKPCYLVIGEKVRSLMK
ncbi:unnamed protein product [Dibothriocephalus latus]|uniref:PDZ domain-containing protein n=1 Tax=Dibothriocephalus latus TaxID=60516 RepID=A0A3P7NT40_DIBLA|nr:unnamed protein product [Dibothriocephalus latus]